jgi:hypothetical protein
VFDFPPYINYYTRYPETLFDGIARVGGFFASSKLLLIALYFINRFWFERKVKSINPDFKDRYSIENFDKIILKIQELEKKIETLEANNN